MPYTNKIRIDTTDYIWTHGRNPRGTGAWAFFIGCRDNLDKLYFVPGSNTYTQSCRLAVQEARRQGVDFVSVGS